MPYLGELHTLRLNRSNGFGSTMQKGLGHSWLISTLNATY
jgi:hypothetical protein